MNYFFLLLLNFLLTVNMNIIHMLEKGLSVLEAKVALV